MICTHSLDELLAVLADDASRELDLAEAAEEAEPTLAESFVGAWDEPDSHELVHLLSVLGVEWTPSTAHLKQ